MAYVDAGLARHTTTLPGVLVLHGRAPAHYVPGFEAHWKPVSPLHPTASHYIKVLLDAIFGHANFRNEIVWKRTSTHSDSRTWSLVIGLHPFLLKRQAFTWNTPHVPHSDEYIASKYRHRDGDGRLYQLDNMTSPTGRPNMMYEWKGAWSPLGGTQKNNGGTGCGRPHLVSTFEEGKYDISRRPRLKRYLDEMTGAYGECLAFSPNQAGKLKNASATRHKSLWHCLSASSQHRPISEMLC